MLEHPVGLSAGCGSVSGVAVCKVCVPMGGCGARRRLFNHVQVRLQCRESRSPAVAGLVHGRTV